MFRDLALHGGVLALLVALGFLLPAYHHGNLARIMVLATFATGYNIAFGYTGLLSLGHAMFFAAGIYGAGLTVEMLGWPAGAGFLAGTAAGAALALVAGLPALRTTGVAFLIVTLMFSQAAYLAILYFGEVTRGDEGFVIEASLREIGGVSLADAETRYVAALALFAVALIGQLVLVRSGPGRVLVAMRENEERARMLGYDPFRARLGALVLSGLYAGAAGAAYALLFGYAGATFGSIQYSILPLLWVLLGGAGTTLGPLVGTAAMFYLVNLSSSLFMPWLAGRAEALFGVDATGLASAYMIVVGIALVALVLFAPAGILGALRRRALPWLP
ncbi:MAG TPA: branched-chain amino acid ABC transporter permease [Paracoccaceae bacterium]|nr:branched-chain amino acid ABC transporter permease [Paracoccaceae bacterium]